MIVGPTTKYNAIWHNGVNVMAQNKGEYRVGIDFNPSGNSQVDFLKAKAASLIMDIDGIHNPDADQGEVARLKALAMTAVEEAAMWAVKAVTKRAADHGSKAA